jgi:hypothetical protein
MNAVILAAGPSGAKNLKLIIETFHILPDAGAS